MSLWYRESLFKAHLSKDWIPVIEKYDISLQFFKNNQLQQFQVTQNVYLIAGSLICFQWTSNTTKEFDE